MNSREKFSAVLLCFDCYNEFMNKKEMILEESVRLFSERGYYGTGLSELLKACGIPKGSFYYYFPEGKIQLAKETLIYSYENMKGTIVSEFFLESNPLMAFERMADYLTRSVKKKDRFASLLLTMISIESKYLDPSINQTCLEIYADWQNIYLNKFLQFNESRKDAKRNAQAVFALIHGSLISSWIKNDPSDLIMAKEELSIILCKYASASNSGKEITVKKNR